MNLLGGYEDKINLFRKANVLVTGGVMYPEDSPLTDRWFINLMKKQALKIE